MGITFFAHEGHDHSIPATMVPWWQDELTVSIALLLGFALLMGGAYFIGKAKFPLLMVLAMAYLLVVGMLCYAVAPLMSIIALAVGMFLALATTMLQLAHKKQPQ